MAGGDPLEPILEEADRALEEGLYEHALARFEDALARDAEHWGAALGRAETLHLLWRTDEALRLVRLLRPPAGDDDDPDRADLEARILEVKGDYDRADRLFTRAARLAPDDYPPPVRTAREDFRAILDEVLAGLPQAIRGVVGRVPVVVEEKPSREMADRAPHITPEVLGLFVGTPVGEQLEAAPGYPDVVLLFKRNLERMGQTREEVAEEIRVTLLHEYGHYLGYDEEDLDRLGLA